MSQSENKKKVVGEKAVEYIEDKMTVGLGSGTTVYWMLKKLGEKVKDGFNVKGIPTSKRTEKWAKQFGIPLTNFSQVNEIDLAIDGANEIDPHANLIKGGGGSLLREKIVNDFADKLIIIADDSKLYDELGQGFLPVEIVPFGCEVTIKSIEKLGCKVKVRMSGEEVFITDNGNYIIDCQFDYIKDPIMLHHQLKSLTGVIETGLFCNMTDQLIIGYDKKVEILTPKT